MRMRAVTAAGTAVELAAGRLSVSPKVGDAAKVAASRPSRDLSPREGITLKAPSISPGTTAKVQRGPGKRPSSAPHLGIAHTPGSRFRPIIEADAAGQAADQATDQAAGRRVSAVLFPGHDGTSPATKEGDGGVDAEGGSQAAAPSSKGQINYLVSPDMHTELKRRWTDEEIGLRAGRSFTAGCTQGRAARAGRSC